MSNTVTGKSGKNETLLPFNSNINRYWNITFPSKSWWSLLNSPFHNSKGNSREFCFPVSKPFGSISDRWPLHFMHVHCCTLASVSWPSMKDSAGWSDCSLRTQCSYQGTGQWPQCCATATSRSMRWVADWVAPWKEYFSTTHLWSGFLHVSWGPAN